MRSDVEIAVSAGDRARLEAIVAAPGSPQKPVWRARIILLSGDGVGTMAIARQAGVAKPTVWRWQERFMTEGMAGLLREKSRPPGIAPLPAETVDQVLSLTGVRDRIRSIIEHLLKLEHSPAKEPRAGWRATVRGQRVKLRDALTPLLHREAASELPALYQDARALAEGTLRDYGEHPAADALPESCPYSLDQITSDWLPS